MPGYVNKISCNTFLLTSFLLTKSVNKILRNDFLLTSFLLTKFRNIHLNIVLNRSLHGDYMNRLLTNPTDWDSTPVVNEIRSASDSNFSSNRKCLSLPKTNLHQPLWNWIPSFKAVGLGFSWEMPFLRALTYLIKHSWKNFTDSLACSPFLGSPSFFQTTGNKSTIALWPVALPYRLRWPSWFCVCRL